MLQHFGEHLRQAQQGKANKMNGEAIQLNIFTAVLSSLKGLVDARANFIGQEEVMKAAVDLILGEKYFHSVTWLQVQENLDNVIWLVIVESCYRMV